MTQAPFQAHSLTTLGSKKPGQLNWIRQYPDRIFHDKECQRRILLPDISDNLFIHRIVVASGASQLAKKHFQRACPGLNIYSIPISKEHTGGKDLIIGIDPFTIIYPNQFKKFTHVFDEETFKNLMDEFDTVIDLVDYLQKKQNFLFFTRYFAQAN